MKNKGILQTGSSFFINIPFNGSTTTGPYAITIANY